MVDVILIGAGWHAREVACYIKDLSSAGGNIRLAGLIDENKAVGPWLDSQILGDFAALRRFVANRSGQEFRYLTATGSNSFRRRFVEAVERPPILGLEPWTLIHPSSYVGREIEIGAGTCVAPGAVLTTQIRIGAHGIVNANVAVHHDCVIGDFVNLNPGATICGNVRIGDDCFIGAGATVIDKVEIGAGTIVGAGAVVTGNLPPNVTAVGVPARVIKTHG